MRQHRSPDNLLGKALWALIERADLSVDTVANRAGADRSYLYRLLGAAHDWLDRPVDSTHAPQPARDLIIRIGFVLALSIEQTDELLLLAGYAPLYPAPRRRL